MSDVSKIKLGQSIYNIKDQAARYGFSTASIVVTRTGNQKSTNLVFYGDAAKQTELGRVDISDLDIKSLTANAVVADAVGAPAIITSVMQLDNSTAGVSDSTSISVDKSSGKPVIKFNSTTDGTTAGTATEVVLPLGASGEIALKSQLDTIAQEYFKNGEYDYANQSLKFYSDTAKTNLVCTIPLDDISVSYININDGNIRFDADTNSFKFSNPHVTGGGIIPAVTLNVSNNGEVAKTSDLADLYANVFAQVYYNSSNEPPQIEFYGGDVQFVNGEPPATATPIGVLDATAFIKDAMVSDVRIDQATNQLVITWTDPDNEIANNPTRISLSEIFDAQNYYTKTETNNAITGNVVNNLTSTETTKALSANQGKVLDEKITSLSNAAVKKISLNGKQFSPSSGNVTLPDMVTKIQLNGKEQALTKNNATGVGTINLDNIPTIIKFNGTNLTVDKNTTTGAGTVTINETDPIFSASPAAGITAQDIDNWRDGAGGITGIQYTTSGTGNSQKHLLQKKTGTGSYSSFVELPTAYVDAETLEIVLAKAPN